MKTVNNTFFIIISIVSIALLMQACSYDDCLSPMDQCQTSDSYSLLTRSDIKITNKKFYTKNLYEYLGQESLIINSKNIEIEK